MRQLSGLDAAFLYLETPNAPLHIGGLAIYDPSTAPGGKVGFKQIIANVGARAHQVRAMTEHLVNVPLRLDHPYWRTDENFDLEYHIRHMALPQPGDWRQLCILLSRLHARPMDLSRPLWEMNIIEGLDGVEGLPKGCFGVFTKIHHAAIDGASGQEISATIHDLEPTSEPPKPAAKSTPTPDPDPSAVELIVRSQINTLKQPLRFFGVVRNTFPALAKTVAGLATGKLERVRDIPRTRFNTNVSPHRVFDGISISLDDVRQIKNSVEGATVNDVALSICGGALRKYLSDKNELPKRSLAAMAPINIRTKDKLGRGGNEVSQMTVRVRSDIEDARKRLKAVSADTQRAKELTHAIGAKTMTDYSQFTPSTLTAAAARLSSRFGLADMGNPNFNCVITNVPGPQIPLYFTGAQMQHHFGVGPPVNGIGLFHAIMSYCGRITIAATSCRDIMPDPAFYARCLQASFDELLQSAQPVATRSPKAKRRTATKTSRKKAANKKAKKKPAKKAAREASTKAGNKA